MPGGLQTTDPGGRSEKRAPLIVIINYCACVCSLYLLGAARNLQMPGVNGASSGAVHGKVQVLK